MFPNIKGNYLPDLKFSTILLFYSKLFKKLQFAVILQKYYSLLKKLYEVGENSQAWNTFAT